MLIGIVSMIWMTDFTKEELHRSNHFVPVHHRSIICWIARPKHDRFNHENFGSKWIWPRSLIIVQVNVFKTRPKYAAHVAEGPSFCLLNFLRLMPQALHRVLGPDGPALHSGVLLVLQSWQNLSPRTFLEPSATSSFEGSRDDIRHLLVSFSRRWFLRFAPFHLSTPTVLGSLLLLLGAKVSLAMHWSSKGLTYHPNSSIVSLGTARGSSAGSSLSGSRLSSRCR